jgi:hypothetical protein
MTEDERQADLRGLLLRTWWATVTDEHREIARAVFDNKQHVGPIGMIEIALALQDHLKSTRNRITE